ncbi:hypothetical protein [Paraglaciecola sp.]|uniref:OmpP1/FadL family transporter n=1 Tax=Paraglaciecola sp. TaxID=1920173 RepID=UPI0032675C81
MKNGFTCWLLVAIVQSSLADEYHYNNLLIGKNAVGLGGAFTAVANDLSTIFYNPAGLVKLGSRNMASINTFAWEETSFKRVYGAQEDFNRQAFSVVPGFFGVSQTTDTWTLGAALMVTDYSKERSDGDVYFDIPATEDTYSVNQNQFATIDIDNAAYQLSFAGARSLSEHWNIGLSLALEYRQFETYQASGVVTNTDVGIDVIEGGFFGAARFSDEKYFVIPSLSVLYEAEAFSFGAKLTKNIAIKRQHDFSSTIFVSGISSEVPGINTANRIHDSSEEKQRYPINVRLGAAYQFDSIRLSLDVSYYEAVDMEVHTLESLSVPITRPFSSITNYAAGIHYKLSEKTSLQFGLFTDDSMSIIDPSIDNQRLEKVDLKGVSFAYNTFVFELPITTGIYIKTGAGKVRLGELRTVESVTGLDLYPPSTNNDIYDASKQTIIGYFSVNF